jgi:aspartate aminotransferase
MKKLSDVGNGIIGSEIIKISQQIKEIAKTKRVANLTIGDFDSQKFPIPQKLTDSIKKAYDDGLTNYPLSQGELALRNEVSENLKSIYSLDYSSDEILIGGGVRPLIYTVYKATVNPGDSVIYPVPSWNNNHYCFLHSAEKIEIECTPENSFFPTGDDIRKSIKENTSLVSICSPQNPTGRIIPNETLREICYAIVEENNKRKEKPNARPVYLFFDQIYSELTGIDQSFSHPMYVCPEIRDYLICADGISKSLNATGIRVGWLFGPKEIVAKLTEIFSHIGAWAPKPEQNAVANFLKNSSLDYQMHIADVLTQYGETSTKICNLFEDLKQTGFDVDYQTPEGGIYISIYLGFVNHFANTENYISFLIDKCGLGIVPFEYFGSKSNKGWFRISVGNVNHENIDDVLAILKNSVLKSHSHMNSVVM